MGGKPKSNAGRKPVIGEARDNVVGVRLTDEELASWEAVATADGRTISGWLRHLAAQGVKAGSSSS